MLKNMFHPRHWFDSHMQPEMELMDTFAKSIETQVAQGIQDFHEKKVVDAVNPHEEEFANVFVEHHLGLDDQTWDLNEIFEAFFPNLQRRSAFITLFSFYEHELDSLCQRFKRAEKLTLSLKDVRGNGLEPATLFLEKVAQLPPQRDTPHWMEIKMIQSIRNLFVHADGRVNTQQKAELAYINSCNDLSLNKRHEVIIGGNFLSHTLGIFKKHFQDIDAAIQAKYATQ
ncbi:hypothetical protein [Caballeronia sp. RCC_10]|uniref:hypothetical protein n=1 Tax=Caballeronia sp. RCC_10 TaxID=3239227 RepID=UPI0035237C9C